MKRHQQPSPAQSAVLHTHEITPPLLPLAPLFPQTNAGVKRTWSFTVRLLPVQSPQAGFLNHHK